MGRSENCDWQRVINKLWRGTIFSNRCQRNWQNPFFPNILRFWLTSVSNDEINGEVDVDDDIGGDDIDREEKEDVPGKSKHLIGRKKIIPILVNSETLETVQNRLSGLYFHEAFYWT